LNKFNIYIAKGFIFFFIVSLAGLSQIYNYQSIITYGFLPFIFLYGLYLNSFKSFSIVNGYAQIYLGIIIISIFLILVLPVDFNSAVTNLLKITGVYLGILLTIELLSFKEYDFTELFLLSFISSFIIISVYALIQSSVLINPIANIEETDRGMFDLNANTYSYYAFFSIISTFYLIEFRVSFIYKILSIFISILGIYMSLITASRSGLLFMVFLPVLYWLFIFKSKRLGANIKLLISSILIFIFLFNLYGIYSNSYIKYRIDTSLESGDAREDLVFESFIAIEKEIITGYGPGQLRYHIYNKHSYSHNSFTEIAGDLGIFGLILLLLLLITPIIIGLKMYFNVRYKMNKNIIKLNILFFLFFLFYNNFYTFYQTIFGMIFFIVIVNIQDRIRFSIYE